MIKWRDPLDFVHEWAMTLPVDVPLSSEVTYAKDAIEHHAVLLYALPLNWKKRPKNYFARRAMRDYQTSLEDKGFIQTIKDFKDYGMSFLRSFYLTAEGEVALEFSEDLMCSPIKGALIVLQHDFLNTGEINYDLAQWILSWFWFLAKIPLERPDLSEPTRSAWLEVQSEVREREIYNSALCNTLARIVKWLINIDTKEISVGHHGPGSTATGAKTIPDKNRDYAPTLQTSQLTKHHPVDDVRIAQARVDPNLYREVTKDIGSLRPITAEPAAMQFAQQGLKELWYRTNDDLSHRKPIDKFVLYRDQGRARRLALKGSRSYSAKPDSKPATVDLSRASDYLSLETVIALFSGDLLHLLLSGRSWDTKVGDDLVELGMFAGMGSALTFPVQTTVFTAVAVLSTIFALHKKELGIAPQLLYEVLPEDLDDTVCRISSDGHSAAISSHLDTDFISILGDYLDADGFKPEYAAYADAIQVYGDDIIVPELAVTELLNMLESLGLVVNEDKSFYGSSLVRESCGIFALNGYDITPLRYRVPSYKNDGLADSATFEGLRSLANFSYMWKYWILWRKVISTTKSIPKFMNKNETKRSKSRPVMDELLKWNSLSQKFERQVAYGSQPLGQPELLFEEFRGITDDYVGFISHTSSAPTHNVRLWDTLPAFTTYAGKSVDDKDSTSEFYHLYQQYETFRLSALDLEETSEVEKIGEIHEFLLSDISSAAGHGKIPRGVRLVKRNAILHGFKTVGRSQMAWGLAPG